MRSLSFVFAFWSTISALAAPATQRPFGVDDMLSLARLGSFATSPDGRLVAYAVSTPNVTENRSTSAIWIAAIDGSSPPRRITAGSKHDTSALFSASGRELYFLSDRDGAPQLYGLDLSGGEPRQITRLPYGADAPRLSRDGRFAFVTTEVFAECADLSCTDKAKAKQDASKVSARVAERLLYRHWDSFRDGRRVHVIRIDLASNEVKDVTPGNFDSPRADVGGGEYDVSPDGKFLAVTSNRGREEAASTNTDVWEIALDGRGAARNLTAANLGYDGDPRYSPDGRSLAFRSQRTPKYESDRFELRLIDRQSGALRTLSDGFDNWVEEYTFSQDSRRILLTATVKAYTGLYAVDVAPAPAPVGIRPLAPALTAGSPIALPSGDILFSLSSLKRAAELYRIAPNQTVPVQVTHLNDAVYARSKMGEVIERSVPSSDGKSLHALMVFPPGFDAKRRYPALLLVHGGPQGAWEHRWTYRWNAEVFASAGYVVYLANPRGSTGYGQEFVRAVSGDWGGKVYDDLMRYTDDLAALPYVDAKRIGAAGGSFGGFMVNWFQGHTQRFVALLSHAGIADQRSMYGTEELWFPEFEMNGAPWESPLYRALSPSEFAAKFSTPELIVHGERDFRVPVGEALQMFSLLQRRGVASKLVLFPDENHWVLKPANSRFWYATFLDWFHRYLGGAPADRAVLDAPYSVVR